MDLLVMTILLAALVLAFLPKLRPAFNRPDPVIEMIYAVFLFTGWIYWAGLESSGMRGTLGKRVFGLMVTTLDGGRISFARASGRYFAKILSAMIFYLGFIMAAFTPKRQGLHDLIAGTLVVRRSGHVETAVWQDPNQPFYR